MITLVVFSLSSNQILRKFSSTQARKRGKSHFPQSSYFLDFPISLSDFDF